MTTYLVATTKPWNISAFHRCVPNLPGDWHLCTHPEDLTTETIEKLQPRYIFFPHWSWLVGQEILARAECVCFHASDVPYGRGGSPIQNLIVRGHAETQISALRMTRELDAGPIYMKHPLSLRGRGQAIFENMAELIWKMIARIVATEPTAQPQNGDVVVFPRRTPAQGALPNTGDLQNLYDHIRMLDADTYPPAFLDHGAFRLEFSHAELENGTLTAQVVLRCQAPKSTGETSS
ncbi:MAG: hypothetical protein JXQ84_09410 [Rhodospirillaceae bacterium]|nr:hypothetical protein [Rhodospirillaceae bacterium]